MNATVISIGNSKGIRLPKFVLEKYQIENSVELILEDDCIRIKPIHKPRFDWDERFKSSSPDELILPDVFEDENLEEW